MSGCPFSPSPPFSPWESQDLGWHQTPGLTSGGPPWWLDGGPTLGSDKCTQSVGPRGAPAVAEEMRPQNKPWATMSRCPPVPRASPPFPCHPAAPRASVQLLWPLLRTPASPHVDFRPAHGTTCDPLPSSNFSPSALSIPTAPVCYQHLPTLCQ